MTKKELLNRIEVQGASIASLTATIKNREDRLSEHSDEILRLQQTLDDVEAANRDLHVKAGLAQTKINHLTSALKSVIVTL